MQMKRASLLLVVILLAVAFPSIAQAGALTIKLTATYWIMAEHDQDTNRDCCATVTNLVLSHLGLDGLPVASNQYIANGYVKDVNSADEITWWSPGFNSDVTYLGTGTASIPFFSKEFPPSGTDANGFLTAEFQGQFDLPSASRITITTTSDDDSFLYIDGNLVVDNAGVKHFGTVSGTDVLGAGQHSMTVFYADRETSDAGLGVSSLVVTPEPATLSLLGIGLLGVGLGVKKRLLIGVEARSARELWVVAMGRWCRGLCCYFPVAGDILPLRGRQST